jgi:hypothetical protein
MVVTSDDAWAEPPTTPLALRQRWASMHTACEVVGFYGCKRNKPHWYLSCPRAETGLKKDCATHGHFYSNRLI